MNSTRRAFAALVLCAGFAVPAVAGSGTAQASSADVPAVSAAQAQTPAVQAPTAVKPATVNMSWVEAWAWPACRDFNPSVTNVTYGYAYTKEVTPNGLRGLIYAGNCRLKTGYIVPVASLWTAYDKTYDTKIWGGDITELPDGSFMVYFKWSGALGSGMDAVHIILPDPAGDAYTMTR